jgi:predicted transcriptional regulator of viral defense system
VLKTAASEKIVGLVGRKGVVRARDLTREGVTREHLRRLLQRGQLQRIGVGLYSLPGADISEHRSLAEACSHVPRGVICLLSALRFHNLTTQNPFEVWMAIPHKAWRPKSKGPRLRLVHLSGQAMTSGIEEHSIEGVPVRVFNPAKAVADCFKFRNKIGLDVAVEALRDYRRKYRSGADELWRMAKICRVTAVMGPYLEALAWRQSPGV